MGDDIPFVKLSNSARKSIHRGWYREAVLQLKHEQTKYMIQCSIWKDMKIVAFLHSHNVGASQGHTVKRHTMQK